jgi:hypothetical protein
LPDEKLKYKKYLQAYCLILRPFNNCVPNAEVLTTELDADIIKNGWWTNVIWI